MDVFTSRWRKPVRAAPIPKTIAKRFNRPVAKARRAFNANARISYPYKQFYRRGGGFNAPFSDMFAGTRRGMNPFNPHMPTHHPFVDRGRRRREF